jgi:hypothetical protein
MGERTPEADRIRGTRSVSAVQQADEPDGTAAGTS